MKMNFRVKHYLSIALIFFTFFGLNAQSKTIEINVNWGADKGICTQCEYNKESKEIYASQLVNLNLRGNKNFNYEVISIDYEQTPLNSLFSGIQYSESVNLNIAFKKARFEHFMVASFDPLVDLNGKIAKVSKIKLKVNYNNNLGENDREHIFADESVLRKGEWYKIGVPQSGMYKIDKNFLENLGISVDNLNPKHINIYGNHISELPIVNSISRPDDLVKNSIFIQGENDNTFNDADYIIFYATGPMVETNIVSEGFNYQLNSYDSLTYYYLNIDASEAPKRIQTIADASATTTHNTNSFNEVSFYEKDFVNLLKSGDIWVGEEFDITTEQSFSLPATNVVTSVPVKLKAGVVVNAPSGSRNFKVSVNGSFLGNVDGSLLSGAYTKGVRNFDEFSFNISSSIAGVDLEFQKSNPATVGWLDYLQLNYRRYITNSVEQIRVRDWNSVGNGNTTEFSIINSLASTQVWDVTDATNAKLVNTSNSGGNLIFKQNTDSLRTFTVFTNNQALEPIFIGKVKNQNLHSLSNVDYLIIKHSSLTDQANRLADLHRNQGLSVHVVDIQDVYNEFSSGLADPVAVRWIAKMFYERGQNNPDLALQSLLLFGDGSYDAFNRVYEEVSTNLLPTYQNPGPSNDNGSITLISSFTSDDFFGILDDDEAMNPYDLIDIGVGRFPVHTPDEAKGVVDKIEHYMNYGSTLYSNTSGVACDANGYASTLGDWRTRSLLIADDENNGEFVFDCEDLSDTLNTKFQEMNIVKVYLDAFQQEATSSGQRYPEVENAINQLINSGALVANYVGHGGETGLAAERILSIPMMKSWTNINKLPLFVSATCEFSRFDDPERVSAGELMLTLPYGGAIGLLTTTRLVYITTNSLLVRNLYSVLYLEENNQSLSFGEIIRRSKNLTAGSDNNFRNFTLLGDPGLKMGKPSPGIISKTLNGININQPVDTLKALSKITIESNVTDANGVVMTGFNGIAYPTVYDKAISRVTLSQDSESPAINFEDRSSILYKGKSTVTNGKFSFSFVVPKDINYDYGKGKLSYYAENGQVQKVGYDTVIVIGGVDPNGIQDDIGPEIDLYMNDLNFVNGGITDENPIFIAKVKDDNGINTTGNGIGHDITLIIDGETASPILLNNYYEADLDTYQSGEVNYQLLNLEEGQHTATFKVWDVNNNSSELTLNFEVKAKEEIAISHLLNYPNPFTTRTEFFFEHNQVCSNLDTRIEIFTISGKLVKTIIENVNTTSYRTSGIAWDARDDFGDKLARGVYIYRLSIEMENGEKAEKLEKLVIL